MPSSRSLIELLTTRDILTYFTAPHVLVQATIISKHCLTHSIFHTELFGSNSPPEDLLVRLPPSYDTEDKIIHLAARFGVAIPCRPLTVISRLLECQLV